MPSDPPRTRRATADDHAAAVEVWQRADRARGVVDRGPETLDHIRAMLADPGTMALVAEVDGRLVGIATAVPARADGGQGEPVAGLAVISMVFVDPDHWGAGVGGVLVDDLLAALRAAGYVRVQLWVRDGNERALRLYTRRGFHPDGSRAADDVGHPIVLLARDL